MSDFVVRRNDNLVVFSATLSDASGPVDLTGAVIRFHMIYSFAGTVKVNALATADPNQTLNKGKVTYTLLAADLVTAGSYLVEFQATFGNGAVFTFPTREQSPNLIINVIEDLA